MCFFFSELMVPYSLSERGFTVVQVSCWINMEDCLSVSALLFLHNPWQSIRHTTLCSSLHFFFSWSFTGAIEPMKCPLGYKEFDGSPRATFEDTCEPCLPGSYGADPNRALCQPCRAGVVCLAAATTDNPVSNGSSLASSLGPNATNSYLCPPGENSFILGVDWWSKRIWQRCSHDVVIIHSSVCKTFWESNLDCGWLLDMGGKVFHFRPPNSSDWRICFAVWIFS